MCRLEKGEEAVALNCEMFLTICGIGNLAVSEIGEETNGEILTERMPAQ